MPNEYRHVISCQRIRAEYRHLSFGKRSHTLGFYFVWKITCATLTSVHLFIYKEYYLLGVLLWYTPLFLL